MFDVGGGELILLFIIALLVLGPQRLPKVAAELGKWVGRARRTATQLRRQLEHEVELNDIVRPPKPPPAPPAPPSHTAETPPAAQDPQPAAASAAEASTAAPAPDTGEREAHTQTPHN